MKQIYILAVLISSLSYGQIPTNYYDSVEGLTGFALKTKLKSIVSNGHQARSYGQLYDGDGISGSNGYKDTHTDEAVSSGENYENDGTILDMYSENPSGSDPYNYNHGSNNCGNYSAEGDCYNREHLIPQSSFGSRSPMQSDIHHVVPSDGRVNGYRGSYPFGNVNTPSWTSLNGSKRGTSAMSGYNGTVFEPIDEFKGDIARAVLYFAVRYEETVNGYTSFDMFNGTNDEVFYPWAIAVLLDWHYNVDPVDQRERNRNVAAYAFQNNANPFVDHPEYASMIWNPVTDNEAPTAATNLVASNPTGNSVVLNWTAGTDNIAVTSYDVYKDGSITTSSSNTSITVTGLAPNTEYCFTVYSKDGSQNISPVSNESCMTTLEGNTSSNDLFISEYVEGLSYNKAIEIANFTGSSINLSNYSIARDRDGSGEFNPALPLTGTLESGNVHVIANTQAYQETLDRSNQTSDTDAISFNGNDPVGLFKNGVLIDFFGEIGGAYDFKNKTFRRKAAVKGPTTTFNLAGEWDEYETDTVTDLGTHTLSVTVNVLNETNVTLYPNPVQSNELYFNSNTPLNVEIYAITGKLILSENLKNSSKSIHISDLNSGLYIVKMTSDFGVQVKKLIRQ
ncbi:MAG: endonuclease [Flavobacteriaceae bacterium]|nr:endonuclease [Flavobacteriaceae bacterium]